MLRNSLSCGQPDLIIFFLTTAGAYLRVAPLLALLFPTMLPSLPQSFLESPPVARKKLFVIVAYHVVWVLGLLGIQTAVSVSTVRSQYGLFRYLGTSCVSMRSHPPAGIPVPLRLPFSTLKKRDNADVTLQYRAVAPRV